MGWSPLKFLMVWAYALRRKKNPTRSLGCIAVMEARDEV